MRNRGMTFSTQIISRRLCLGSNKIFRPSWTPSRQNTDEWDSTATPISLWNSTTDGPAGWQFYLIAFRAFWSGSIYGPVSADRQCIVAEIALPSPDETLLNQNSGYLERKLKVSQAGVAKYR